MGVITKWCNTNDWKDTEQNATTTTQKQHQQWFLQHQDTPILRETESYLVTHNEDDGPHDTPLAWQPLPFHDVHQ